MRQIYQRIVAQLSNNSPSSPSTDAYTPSTPTTPGRKNLSRELRVDPELQQRRQLYHCGTNFYTIDEIPKWGCSDGQPTTQTIPVRNIQLDTIVLPKNNKNKTHKERQNGTETLALRQRRSSCESPLTVNTAMNTNTAVVPVVEHHQQQQKQQQQQQQNAVFNSTNNRPSLSEFNAEINEKISFWRGDITELEIDAIVSPSNEKLSGGGSGTDFNIHRAAGPELAFFNSSLGVCPVGSARLSPGYRLPSKFVISTVVPLKENELALRSCYLSCLDIASMHREIRTVAFSCIVAGEYESEFVKATEVAMRTVRRWLEVPYNRGKIDRIVFVVQSDLAHEVYQDLLPLYFPTVADQERLKLNQRATISSPASGHYQ